MSLSTLDQDCLQKIIACLTRNEAGKLCRVSKSMRNTVENHKYDIIIQGVWELDRLEGPGACYIDHEFHLTITNALARVEELKTDPKITHLTLTQYFAELGFISNVATYHYKVTRNIGDEWKLVPQRKFRGELRSVPRTKWD